MEADLEPQNPKRAPANVYVFSCARCGYRSHNIAHYRRHISRTRPCKPTLADVQPSEVNMVVQRRARDGQLSGGSVTVIGDHNRVNNTNDHSTHTHTHNHSHSHTHNVTINAFGKEDLSHISPEMMRELLQLCAEAGGDRAVAAFVTLVHYNPAAPQNMNVYVPRAGGPVAGTSGAPTTTTTTGSAASSAATGWRERSFAKAYTYDGARWREQAQGTVATALIRDRAGELWEFVEDSQDGLGRAGPPPTARQARAEREYEHFYDRLSVTDPALQEAVMGEAERGSDILRVARAPLAAPGG